jgi:hypothetical protein
MKTITLTDRELLLIKVALYAVSPIGGGSETFTLSRKIETTETDPEDKLLMRFCNNVLEDAEEAGVINRI